MSTEKEALDLFTNGLNCSQAVLSAFGEPYGIDSETAKGLGRALGGGIGRMGLTCGAVSAAILILGAAQKKGQSEDAARDEICESIAEFVRSFEAKHGSITCKDLIGADFSTEEGLRKIKAEGLVRKVCPKYVRDASAILAGLLGK